MAVTTRNSAAGAESELVVPKARPTRMNGRDSRTGSAEIAPKEFSDTGQRAVGRW